MQCNDQVWLATYSNLCSFHISICNPRSIRMDGSKNTRSWIFCIPPTIQSFVIGESRLVLELVLLIALSQDGEDTSKDWICLRSKANGEPYLDVVTGWEEYGHSPTSWCLHMVASRDLKKSNSENNVENIQNVWVCIWYSCFGWPAMVIPRTFCSSIVAIVKTFARKSACYLIDASLGLSVLRCGERNFPRNEKCFRCSGLRQSNAPLVPCPWSLLKLALGWLTDISEIAKIHKIRRGTNKCIEVPLQ